MTQPQSKTYVVTSQNAVQELQAADNGKEGEEGVNQLGTLRRLLDVVVVNILKDLVPVCRSGLNRQRLWLDWGGNGSSWLWRGGYWGRRSS